MAVQVEDIGFYLSVPGAGPGFSDAQADPNDSLGGFISTTAIIDASLHNLFDVITGDENANEAVDYRCFFIRNASTTNDWLGVTVWISDEVAGGAIAAIGLDPAGATAEDSAVAQAATIADEDSAPSGVSFSAPTSKGAGLVIGDIGPEEVAAVWVRRTATDSAAQDLDGVTIRAEGDTGE